MTVEQREALLAVGKKHFIEIKNLSGGVDAYAVMEEDMVHAWGATSFVAKCGASVMEKAGVTFSENIKHVTCRKCLTEIKRRKK